jgi:hypothetical protein
MGCFWTFLPLRKLRCALPNYTARALRAATERVRFGQSASVRFVSRRSLWPHPRSPLQQKHAEAVSASASDENASANGKQTRPTRANQQKKQTHAKPQQPKPAKNCVEAGDRTCTAIVLADSAQHAGLASPPLVCSLYEVYRSCI